MKITRKDLLLIPYSNADESDVDWTGDDIIIGLHRKKLIVRKDPDIDIEDVWWVLYQEDVGCPYAMIDSFETMEEIYKLVDALQINVVK